MSDVERCWVLVVSIARYVAMEVGVVVFVVVLSFVTIVCCRNKVVSQKKQLSIKKETYRASGIAATSLSYYGKGAGCR